MGANPSATAPGLASAPVVGLSAESSSPAQAARFPRTMSATIANVTRLFKVLLSHFEGTAGLRLDNTDERFIRLRRLPIPEAGASRSLEPLPTRSPLSQRPGTR